MKRILTSGLALAVAVGIVAGCGGTKDSGKTDGGSSAGGPEKKGEIVIGEIAALTGPTALTGIQEQKGAQLAVDEINAKGGVAGYTIKLITLDFKGDVQEGLTAYKRLVQQEKAVAVIGTNFSNVNIAISPVTDGLKVPVLHNALDPRSTMNEKSNQTYKYSFLAQPSAIAWGNAMGKVAIENLKAKKVAILVNSGLAFATSQAEPFKEYVKKNGATVVAEEAYAAGTQDYKALLTKIKAAEPDVIMIPQYAQEAGVAAQQAKELGIKAAILGANTMSTSDFTKTAGTAAEGVYFVNNVDMTDKAFTDFNSRFKAKHGEEPKTINALFGYDNVMILADAIKRAGKAEPEAIREALEKTTDVAILQGDGKFTLDGKVHRPKNMPVVLFQWKDGKAVNLGKIAAQEN